jgi:hypothetical protein
MAYFHVGLELGADLVISLFCREFASSGEALAAIRTPPRDRISIDLFCNNQLRHATIMSQIRYFACAIENGPSPAPLINGIPGPERWRTPESFLSGIG